MATGERIGNFEILDVLAEDAFAIDYCGRDQFSHRPALIRVCIAADDSIRQRFLSLAQEAAALRHPNVVQVFAVGPQGGVIAEDTFRFEVTSRDGNRITQLKIRPL